MMSRGERYQIRAKISMLHREANLFEDRKSDAGRVEALKLRQEANELNDELNDELKRRVA